MREHSRRDPFDGLPFYVVEKPKLGFLKHKTQTKTFIVRKGVGDWVGDGCFRVGVGVGVGRKAKIQNSPIVHYEGAVF